ncbi:MAG: alpha/beta hydrolase family protein [bacterium]
MTAKDVLMTLCISALAISAGVADDLQVLGGQGGELLHEYLMREMREQYDARRGDLTDALQSPDAMQRYCKRLHDDYLDLLGPLPEKTPLNAKVAGTIACDDYRIEKVIYESRPNHHVTANIYIPTTGKPPYPGVLVPCGHSANGKADQAYQSVCILLAKNGFVALIYDPIAQGERHQILDAPRHGTTTHTMLNVGALLVGWSIVGWEAWDGMRSLDYLLSRPEVDNSKPVGMTGNSGGGTQTTFLMALDERIGPAAPSCYIMTQQRKYETIGPADGCQHLPYEGARGFEQVDYVAMRAPKPTLILAAEQDFFDFNATLHAIIEAKAIYGAIGQPDRVSLFSYNDEHSFSQPRRQAAVSWMRRWLMNDPNPVVEPPLKLQTDEALQITKSGQVVQDFDDEQTVATLTLQQAKDLEASRQQFWKMHGKKECLAEIRQLIALSDRSGEVKIQTAGTIERNGYSIEKLIIEADNQPSMPALLFIPDNADGKRPATLYVDGRGKAVDANEGGVVEKMLTQGQIVLSIDARGFGETADTGSDAKYYNVEQRVAVLANHIGRPLLGQRVGDVLTALDVLAGRDGVDANRIDLIAVGCACPVALHAAALDGRFQTITLTDPIRSWVDDVVAQPITPDLMGYVVPSALMKYDLPDLVAFIAPRPVRYIESTGSNQKSN